MSNSSIRHIDRTLPGDTTLGQGGPWSDGNKGILCMSQSSSISEASPWDCLVPYAGRSLGESYASAEVQLIYSAVLSQLGQILNPTICLKYIKTYFIYTNKKIQIKLRLNDNELYIYIYIYIYIYECVYVNFLVVTNITSQLECIIPLTVES